MAEASRAGPKREASKHLDDWSISHILKLKIPKKIFINFGGFLDFTKQDYAFSWEVTLSSLGMPLKRIKMKKNIVVEFEDILQRKHIFRRTGGNTTID